ncbi:hypothetical protein Dsin_014555 [Dipteronia sinensis]|uniref:Uncharacterized protein n=1 Tax=Dipteronia sinensis TaxID=43782 RepID=A0AAE0EBP2_9ROSI|nr:hypothetical protein Dsin_014555 [Dipteronia sinensis]
MNVWKYVLLNICYSFVDFFIALYMDEDLEREDQYLEMEDKDLEMEDSKRKMIKYLKPLQFFRETTESDYYMPMKPVFLGLSFTDVDAVAAFSDCYLNQRTYRVFRRDKTLLDKLVDVVQTLQNYPVEKYELLGIIVADNNFVKDIHNLMD